MQHLCLVNDQMVGSAYGRPLLLSVRLLVNKTKLVGVYFALSSATILRCPASSHGNSGILSSYGTRQQTLKAGSGKEAKGRSHSTFSRPTLLTLEFRILQSGLLGSKSLSEGHIANFSLLLQVISLISTQCVFLSSFLIFTCMQPAHFALSGHKIEQAHVTYSSLFLIFLSPDSEVC